MKNVFKHKDTKEQSSFFRLWKIQSAAKLLITKTTKFFYFSYRKALWRLIKSLVVFVSKENLRLFVSLCLKTKKLCDSVSLCL